MAALDNIASELLKSANEADLIYKRTRDQAQKDKAVRLRRIVENLRQLGGGTATLDQVTTAGNTTANTINVGGITSDYFQLDTTATPTLAPGMFAWNDAYGTADLRLKGNNVTLQVGQETLARVVNKTGADLLESQYKVVRVRIASEGGAQGQRLAVVLAQGNNDPDSATTLGIVTEDIPNNQEGFITIFGNVNNINTTGSLQGETWVDGDVLYLSPTTPGSLTKVKPVAPQHTVIIGYVVYAHNNQGKIFVKVDNGYELDELHNVLITSPANNDLLQYNSTQQVWKNIPVGTAVPTPTLAQVTTAGNTTTNAITVGGLTSTGGINAGSNLIGRSDWGQGIINLGSTGEIRFVNGSGGGFFYTWYQNSGGGGVERMRLSTNNNLLIGTTTDAGYKLDVNGTMRIQGATFDFINTAAVFKLGYNTTKYTTFETFSDGATRVAVNGVTKFFIGASTVSGLEVPSSYSIAFVNPGVAFYGHINWNTSTNQFEFKNADKSAFSDIGIRKITTTSSITATSALAQGVYFNNTLVAAANNDVLVGLDINPTFTNGAFTGISNYAIRTAGKILSIYDAPYDSTATNSNFVLQHSNGNQAGIGITSDGAMRVKAPGGSPLVIMSGSVQTWFNRYGHSSIQAFNSDFGIYGVSDTQKFRIFNSTGNVLIQNGGIFTDAGYKLDVNGIARVGDSGGSGQLYIKGFAGTGQYLYLDDGSKVWSLVGSTNYSIQENGTSRLIVKEGGNVGIGTTNPTDKFHIVDNTNGNKFARISAGGTDASAAWVAQNDQVDNIVYRVFGSAVSGSQMGQALARSASLIANLGGTGKFLIGSFSGTDLIFGTSDQARMRLVDATGNFLIGTMTDTGNKLTVSGNIDAQGYKVNNVLGYTGILNIPTNPPGQQNIDIQGGIVINIF